MGTNYYCRKIPSRKRKLELCDLIRNSEDWRNIREEIHKTFDSFDILESKEFTEGQIHLGKRSGGWKFLWNPNIYIINNYHFEETLIEPGHTKYRSIKDPDTYYSIYPLTKDGIWNFINQSDIEVYDEYDEKQDKREFFNMALDWGKENGLDGKTYHTQDNRKYLNPEDKYIRALSKCGYTIEFPYTDFYSDGLRFATFNEFS